MRVARSQGDRFEFFGQKDANGVSTRLTAVRIVAKNGDVTRIGYDDLSRPIDVLTPDGWSFTLAWRPDGGSFVLTGLSPDRTAQTSVPVVLSNVDAASLVSTTAMQDGVASLLAPPLAAAQSPDGTVLATVSGCSVPIDDARVDVTAARFRAHQLLSLDIFPALGIGSGVYQIGYPKSQDLGQAAGDRCREVLASKWTAALCGVARQRSVTTYACGLLATLIGAIDPPAGAIAFRACQTAMTAVSNSCYLIGLGNADFVCAIVQKALQSETDDVEFQARAQRGIVRGSSETVRAPGTGPFPGEASSPPLDVRLNLTDIAALRTFPDVDVDAFDGYRAIVELSCASQATKVTMVVDGSDGYHGQADCAAGPTANECDLIVPPRYVASVDRVTVQVQGATPVTRSMTVNVNCSFCYDIARTESPMATAKMHPLAASLTGLIPFLCGIAVLGAVLVEFRGGRFR
jgi:hypothetical protein